MATSTTEAIKDKLDVVELIKSYIGLEPAGRNFKARCPFHQEKTPSFMVSPERQSWHCFGCFPKGSLVKTPIGFHSIDSLRVGDTVVSGKGNEKKILFVHRHMYDGELVHVKTRKLGGEVSLTGDHKVFVIKGPQYKKIYKDYFRRIRSYEKLSPEKYFYKTRKYFPIKEVFARDLSEGELLLYPINYNIQDVKSINLGKYLKRRFRLGPVPSKLPSEIELDENFLKLLGYWIAEGSNHRAYIRFSLGGHEIEFAKEICDLIEKVFNLKSSIHIRRAKKSGIEVTCCHAALADIFGNLCGKGAVNKHIPFELRYLPTEKQSTILNAIWKGDGTKFVRSRSNKNAYSIITISRVLAEQITDILLRKNIFPSTQINDAKVDKNNVNHRESYNIIWGTNNEDKYKLVYRTKEGITYWVLPIASLRKEKFRDEVYNLTVEDDHSYVARNFSVANCGLGGDIFSFVMRYENLEFAEALKILAEKAGVELQRLNPQEYKFFGLLYDLNSAAKDFFVKELENSAEAKNYLKERGLNDEIVKEFEVGFAPAQGDALNLHFVNRGYNLDDVRRAGLAIKTDRGKHFDRFRGRIMFPIHNNVGKIAGFTGRVLPQFDDGKMGKYVNSPETPIFNKSKVLYGFHKSKDYIREAESVFLVEGQTDLLMSWQSGVRNVVASSGIALSSDHLRTLKRLTDNILLSFDSDRAGLNAGERAIDLAENMDYNVKVVAFSGFKDAAEAGLANPENIKKALDFAKPAPEFYFDKYLGQSKKDFSDRDELQNIRAVLTKLKNITSPITQNHWLRELAKRTGLEEKVLIEEADKLEGKKTDSITIEEKPNLLNRKLPRWDMICERLLSAAMNAGNLSVVEDVAGNLAPTYQTIFKAIRAGNKKIGDPNLDEVYNLIALRSEELGENEIKDLKAHLLAEYLKEKRKVITARVKAAEAKSDTAALKFALQELNNLGP